MYLRHVLGLLSQIERGAKILDAGCGGGDFAIGLHEAGYEVFGSDLSVSAIAHARAAGTGRYEVTSLYDHLAEPFEINYFDAIVCVEVIEHLYSPARFVMRAHEALRPGGLLIVSTPYWGYLKNVVLALTNRMDRALTVLWEGGHIKHFSRTTLTKLMEQQGFQTVKFIGCGEGWRAHAPYLWNGMLMAFRKPG